MIENSFSVSPFSLKELCTKLWLKLDQFFRERQVALSCLISNNYKHNFIICICPGGVAL
jgi:hypothetical protein